MALSKQTTFPFWAFHPCGKALEPAIYYLSCIKMLMHFAHKDEYQSPSLYSCAYFLHSPAELRASIIHRSPFVTPWVKRGSFRHCEAVF